MTTSYKYAEIGVTEGNIAECPTAISCTTISGIKLSKKQEFLIISNIIPKKEIIRIVKKFEICSNVLLLKTSDHRYFLMKVKNSCENPKFHEYAEPIGNKNIFFGSNEKVSMVLSDLKVKRNLSFSTNKEQFRIEIYHIKSGITFVSCQYRLINS